MEPEERTFTGVAPLFVTGFQGFLGAGQRDGNKGIIRCGDIPEDILPYLCISRDHRGEDDVRKPAA